MQTMYFLAKLCTCALWASTAIHTVFHYQETTQRMTQKGVPWAGVLLVPVLVMKLGGTLMLLTNYFVWAAVLAWIGFLIFVTAIFHRVYDKDGKFVFPEMIQLTKNISLIGGLLTLLLLDPDKPQWLVALLQKL